MKIEDVKPAHCYARARRLLGEATLIRDELGRIEDGRAVPEIAGAQPRACYIEAIGCWRKAERLANELGVDGVTTPPATASLRDTRPGHVLRVLDSVIATVEAVKQRLGIKETVGEPAVEADRQPSDVLMTIVRVNRELSRCLERPFTPSDVYQTVSLASAYAAALGAPADPVPFERRKKPQHCYEQLTACLAAAAAHVGQKGEASLQVRGTPSDVLPGDVYDMANLVLGEVAFLHALGNAQLVHAFDPVSSGHRLPSHVFQLARTLEKQLTSLR